MKREIFEIGLALFQINSFRPTNSITKLRRNKYGRNKYI